MLFLSTDCRRAVQSLSGCRLLCNICLLTLRDRSRPSVYRWHYKNLRLSLSTPTSSSQRGHDRVFIRQGHTRRRVYRCSSRQFQTYLYVRLLHRPQTGALGCPSSVVDGTVTGWLDSCCQFRKKAQFTSWLTLPIKQRTAWFGGRRLERKNWHVDFSS